MKSPIQLIEEIIRAKMALHLRLVAHRNRGEVEIGGKCIHELIAEVDEGIPRYERMLVYFKNKVAAEVMASSSADGNPGQSWNANPCKDGQLGANFGGPDVLLSCAQSTRSEADAWNSPGHEL